MVAVVRGGVWLVGVAVTVSGGVVWRPSHRIKGPTFSPPSGSCPGRWKVSSAAPGLEAGRRWPGRSGCGNWDSASFLSHSSPAAASGSCWAVAETVSGAHVRSQGTGDPTSIKAGPEAGLFGEWYCLYFNSKPLSPPGLWSVASKIWGFGSLSVDGTRLTSPVKSLLLGLQPGDRIS